MSPARDARRRFLGRSAALAGAAGALGTAGRAAAAPPAPAAIPGVPMTPPPAPGPKVLRYAFRVAETGFDPVRVSDTYSRTVIPHIFESLLQYDHLARPVKIIPLTAVDLPTSNADFTEWTFRIKPGIFFTDDPAFNGKRRELVAGDYAYALRRYADPATKAPGWSSVEEFGIRGLAALREKALKSRQPFDYDTPIEGLSMPDRHTLVLKLEEPRPTLPDSFCDASAYVGIAREVVERYGEQIPGHPVGTGPFKLVAWRRSSQIVLDRNPAYRERRYEDEAHPEPGDAEGQALLAKFRGRKLPMVDRVVVSIVDEQQPRWLSFLNRQHDFIERTPEEFIQMAMPGGKISASLAKRGITGYRNVVSDAVLTSFNMEHPVIGGYTPERVALRRAISLGTNVPREIDIPRRGQAIQANSPLVPYTSGYNPAFRSEMGEYDPARANALLDLYGYADRNGDGWREQPDGAPLLLTKNTQPDPTSRQLDELWQKDMTALKLRSEFKFAKWPENLKTAQSGKYMMWGVASAASQIDGSSSLQRFYGPAKGGANLSRFENKAFDALYEKMLRLPEGPEREALFLEAKRIAVVWAPYKYHLHRIVTDFAHPWMTGWVRPAFWNRWWHLVDIELDKRPSDLIG